MFQYSAGQYLSQRLGTQLLIDTSELRRAKNNHASQISNLDLEGEFIDFEHELGPARYFFHRLAVYAQRKWPGAYKKVPFVPNVYSSPVVGFDPSLAILNGTPFIRGYYQSWKYIASSRLGKAGFQIRPSLHSHWLEENARKISSPDVVAVHVRRGDFLQQGNDWGTLASGYYRDALENLRRRLVVREVWVFTDSHATVSDEFSEMFSEMGLNLVWVDPEGLQDAETSFCLMSRASNIVIANSTYSWWAAMAGDQNKVVYAPTKWFRGRPDPADLMPPVWNLVESKWN